MTTPGRREFVPVLTRAATAAGIDGLFIEVHDDPPRARSDAATVWPLDRLEELLTPCVRIREALGAGDKTGTVGGAGENDKSGKSAVGR
jgi:2-dehydro-3-deoxyphosphooctonate aldolase (KDO 8-P synthase)